LDEDLGRILGSSNKRPIEKFIDDCILNTVSSLGLVADLLPVVA
jgi:hypothetical protein